MTARERFLKIEPRRADAAPESESADRARIAAVIGAAPPSLARPPQSLELAPDAPAGDGATIPKPLVDHEIDERPDARTLDLAIDTAPVKGQPFVRCARCGADSTIHAERCESCGEALDTAEQRAFNEKVWGAQTRRNERERAALAEMAQARVEAVRASIRPLPEPGMKPPPELLEPIRDDDGPILVGVIKALGSTKAKIVTSALVVGMPLLLVTFGGPILAKLGWVAVVLVVLGFLPRSAAKRLFELWSGLRRR